MQDHDRAKRLLESMVNKFRLILSSITAENVKLGRVVAKSLVHIVQKRFALYFFVIDLQSCK